MNSFSATLTNGDLSPISRLAKRPCHSRSFIVSTTHV